MTRDSFFIKQFNSGPMLFYRLVFCKAVDGMTETSGSENKCRRHFQKLIIILIVLGLLDLTLEKNNIELEKYGLQPNDLIFIKELIYGRFLRNSVPNI